MDRESLDRESFAKILFEALEFKQLADAAHAEGKTPEARELYKFFENNFNKIKSSELSFSAEDVLKYSTQSYINLIEKLRPKKLDVDWQKILLEETRKNTEYLNDLTSRLNASDENVVRLGTSINFLSNLISEKISTKPDDFEESLHIEHNVDHNLASFKLNITINLANRSGLTSKYLFWKACKELSPLLEQNQILMSTADHLETSFITGFTKIVKSALRELGVTRSLLHIEKINYNSMTIDLALIASIANTIGITPENIRDLLITTTPIAMTQILGVPEEEISVNANIKSSEMTNTGSKFGLYNKIGQAVKGVWLVSNLSLLYFGLATVILLTISYGIMNQAHEERNMIIRASLDERNRLRELQQQTFGNYMVSLKEVSNHMHKTYETFLRQYEQKRETDKSSTPQ